VESFPADFPSVGLGAVCREEAVDKAPTLVDHALVGAAYAYELRCGEEIFSTGRLTVERELSPGDEVTVAGVVAQVEELSWSNGEPRVILRAAVRSTAN
jgi:hypothetical protein